MSGLQDSTAKEWPEAHAAEQQRLLGRKAVCALVTKLGRPLKLTRGIPVQKKYMGQFPRPNSTRLEQMAVSYTHLRAHETLMNL
eukprot:5678234-Prymnesium_polylepis.1